MKVRNPEEIQEMVQHGSYAKKRIFSVVAHIDHGKTTMTDYLLKKAGLMRPEDAGAMQAMDSDEEEQARGITIFTSVVLLAFHDERSEEGDEDFIFQINDTPGHLSFTGEVSRALRSSDGVILLVDALEGIMTQTETNIRLSIGNERCKPVLFINKVDRLISELRLEPKEVYAQVDKIINSVNKFIKSMQPKGQNWQVSFAKSSVALGSAKHGWAFTMNILKRRDIGPIFVFEKYAENDIEFLRKNLPLEQSILEMVIDFMPNPIEAASYRLPSIVSGVDWESDLGKSLLASDPNGPLMGLIAKIFIDPKSFRPTLIGRVFSGTLKQGDSIYLVNRREAHKIKRMGVMEITDILDMDSVPAGNLFALFGFMCTSGETFISKDYANQLLDADENADLPSFESIKYSSKPVVSRSITPVDPQDLAKLGEVTAKWLMADNTATFELNKESKQYVLSGIDPLQIEILTKRINRQVKINVGEPIIVYRERPDHESQVFHTKSANGHNKLKVMIEPIDDVSMNLSLDGVINEFTKGEKIEHILREQADWDRKVARKVWDVYKGCFLVNGTKGLQRLDRIKSYVVSAFREFVDGGPIAKEPVVGIKATFLDATIHVDPAHTGYGQVAGMTQSGLNLALLDSGGALNEPWQNIDVKTPAGTEGSIIAVISKHRGVIGDITDEGTSMRVKGSLPASEIIGIADEFRGATQGKAFFGYEFDKFKKIPRSIESDIILAIRKRKDMPARLPSADSWKKFIYVRM